MRLITLCLFSLLALPVWAQTLPEPPEVPVKAYIVEDFHSGNVLAEKNADQRLEPASITKLMTGYLIYKALQEGRIELDEPVVISEKAWRTGGSRMFVEVNSQVPVEELLMGMVVQSGNDATVALAEHLAGSEQTFASLMNEEAERLGMDDTHYVNATGWPDPEHYTTARDIAILVRAIIRDFPEEYERYSVREYTYNNITQHNRNRLLWQDESVDGVKTGHTSSAGFCLAASAKRADTRLISVVLGADQEKERFSASRSLLNYGFNFFETHKLFDADTALTEATIWKGKEDELPLGLAEDFYVTIPKGRYQDMQPSLHVNTAIEAPAARGEPFGNVTVTLGERTVAEAPLVALQDVARAGWFGRLIDQILLFIYSLFD